MLHFTCKISLFTIEYVKQRVVSQLVSLKCESSMCWANLQIFCGSRFSLMNFKNIRKVQNFNPTLIVIMVLHKTQKCQKKRTNYTNIDGWQSGVWFTMKFFVWLNFVSCSVCTLFQTWPVQRKSPRRRRCRLSSIKSWKIRWSLAESASSPMRRWAKSHWVKLKCVFN